jgi:hypothetical protein
VSGVTENDIEANIINVSLTGASGTSVVKSSRESSKVSKPDSISPSLKGAG